MGLPEDSRLRESLTKKPPEDMRQLMRRIEEYKRLEDDRLQSKCKAPMINHPRQTGFPLRARGNLRIQKLEAQVEGVNVTFKEPIHRIVDKIRHEPYFRWLNKIGGKGHTTEQCRVLKDLLGQLAKAGYLKEFVIDAGDREARQGAPQRANLLPPPLRIIEVIHAALRSLIATGKKGVLTVASVEGGSNIQPYRKKIKLARELIAFSDDDLEGTIQLHNNALIVAARISSFLVKRVMINQGSSANVMYLDLFRGLKLRNRDFLKYNTPLVGFDGKVVVLKGQISLPVNMEGKEVVVTFIVVASYSPYMAILGRPWIHAMGAILSTLHVKVKFPNE
nr:uncharacterized protein LOC112003468 [Quercus suber]